MTAPGRSAAGTPSNGWTEALTAAALFAVDPNGLGGIRVRALPGPVRERWLARLRILIGDDRPWRRMPAHIRDERLLGGLDLTATLRAGRAIAQRGLLADADGGVVEIAMAERVDGSAAARIAAAMDTGRISLAREGLGGELAARFAVVALDEGDMEAAEAPPTALCDRLAFTLDLHAISWRECEDDWFDAQQVADARERLGAMQIDDECVEALTGTALALGVWSMRPTLFAVRAARAAAALNGNDWVSADDVALAAQLVLAPRATQLPPAPPPPPEEEEEPPPPEDDNQDESDEDDSPEDEETTKPLEDQVLDAASAAIPADVLRQLAMLGGARRSPSSRGGKAGAQMRSTRRGRPMGSEPGNPGGGNRLAVIDTLRAAAPWQEVRRRQQPPPEGPAGAISAPAPLVNVQRDDFRVVRFRERQETTTVFVVDASGSAALQRLAEAKGAVELLLADCYVRRDQVALIAFRGREAQLLLPPTRSLVRAKRELAALPGGGGTPIAAGLDAARQLVDQLRRQGQSVALIVLTDGRANVRRDGSGGREAAMEDALSAAKSLAGEEIQSVLIDVSRKPQPKAQELAQAMQARYLPLPSADAATLSAAVRSTTGMGA